MRRPKITIIVLNNTFLNPTEIDKPISERSKNRIKNNCIIHTHTHIYNTRNIAFLGKSRFIYVCWFCSTYENTSR